MNDQHYNGPPKRPLFVRLSLWGINSRNTAIASTLLCVAFAIFFIYFEFTFFALFAAFTGFSYWYSLRWVDKNQSWPPAPPSAKYILIGVVCASFLTGTFIQHFFISYYNLPQNGMYPGLPTQSKIFCLKRAYSISADVTRGDVVTLLRKKDGDAYIYVWRVIGLPGDSVKTTRDELAVNGEAVQRKLVHETEHEKIFSEKIGNAQYLAAYNKNPEKMPPDVTVTVPENNFYVMGDNRFDAYDSRYLGFIPFAEITGRKIYASH